VRRVAMVPFSIRESRMECPVRAIQREGRARHHVILI